MFYNKKYLKEKEALSFCKFCGVPKKNKAKNCTNCSPLYDYFLDFDISSKFVSNLIKEQPNSIKNILNRYINNKTDMSVVYKKFWCMAFKKGCQYSQHKIPPVFLESEKNKEH